MYFEDRTDAGKRLANQLEKYKNQTCAVVALSDSAVLVGAQIAARLHCVLMLLLMEPIKVPGEPDPVAVINQDGGFSYNNMYSAGQLEELNMEYFGYIEEQKLDKLHVINALLGSGGIIRKDLLREHVVILVSDGLNSGLSLDAAADYLKPVHTQRLVIATPFASVSAVDRMHVLTDEIYCLNVLENYLDTNHYYENNQMPDHQTIISTIKEVVEQWNHPKVTAGRQAALLAPKGTP